MQENLFVSKTNQKQRLIHTLKVRSFAMTCTQPGKFGIASQLAKRRILWGRKARKILRSQKQLLSLKLERLLPSRMPILLQFQHAVKRAIQWSVPHPAAFRFGTSHNIWNAASGLWSPLSVHISVWRYQFDYQSNSLSQDQQGEQLRLLTPCFTQKLF